jgi:hypothetical protein
MNFWNPEEYVVRYATTVINFQNFCTANNIKFLNFNSFYRQKNKNIDEWRDVDMREQLLKLNANLTKYDVDRNSHAVDYSIIWDKVDPIRYYNKDDANNSFKTFVDNHCSNGYNGWHPNHDAHALWANELHQYILEHELLL